MPSLEVPAASLYYETIGQGPLLLCISGASGDAEGWRPLVEGLKHSFTVVIYDRELATLLSSERNADKGKAVVSHAVTYLLMSHKTTRIDFESMQTI